MDSAAALRESGVGKASKGNSTLKQAASPKQNVSQGQGNAQGKKGVNELKVRKVRSKSPPTNESGYKLGSSKVKKYFDDMIPAFTNKKRQNAYYSSSKRGFTYVNWDMENELYIF